MEIYVFNAVWFAFFAAMIAFAVIVIKRCKNKTREQKKHVLETITLINLIVFLLYDLWTIINPAVNENPWHNLPFNACNFCIILAYIAVKTNSNKLKAFVFFTGIFTGTMAVLLPSEGYYGASIFIPNVFGFWYTHFMVIMVPVLMVGLDIYEPRYKDIPWAILIFLIISLFAHMVNTIFRKTGLCTNSNYCFTYPDENNPILSLLYSILPVPYLYLFVGAPILAAVQVIQCFIARRLKGLK